MEAWRAYCFKFDIKSPFLAGVAITRFRIEYPNVSDIHARKAEGRLQSAAMTFGQKLAILDAMRERVAPIVQSREARRRRNGQAPLTRG